VPGESWPKPAWQRRFQAHSDDLKNSLINVIIAEAGRSGRMISSKHGGEALALGDAVGTRSTLAPHPYNRPIQNPGSPFRSKAATAPDSGLLLANTPKQRCLREAAAFSCEGTVGEPKQKTFNASL